MNNLFLVPTLSRSHAGAWECVWRNMRIGRPEITRQNGEIIYCVHVQFAKGVSTLWYRLGEQFEDLVTDFSDSPLVALLIPAMLNGEDIYITGTISEKLHYNLSGSYQKLLQLIIPSLHRIRIYPNDVQSGVTHGSGVATGFSGGIDSFCVLADHYYSDIQKGFKLTHLLFNNVGSHCGGEKQFDERCARLKPFVDRIGLPFIKINSNVSAFYRKDFDFLQTHTPRNVSAALLIQKGIRRYMYASGYDYTNTFVGITDDIAYSDTITLPILSTEILDIFSSGSEYTRVEKTLRVANIPDSYSTLDVCIIDKGRNCSTCHKCMRTLVTLDIAGFLDRYSSSFDLNTYKRKRSVYFGKVLKSNEPLLHEIAQFAKQRGFLFPRSSYLYAYLYAWFQDLPSLVKPMVKRLLRQMFERL